MKNQGFTWHCHHDILLEWYYDYKERVKMIKRNKPKHEIKTRLRLFKFIKGKLPDEVVEAGKKYAEAWLKYKKDRQKYTEAWQKFGLWLWVFLWLLWVFLWFG